MEHKESNRLCQQCGFENPDSMKFCGQCGHNLNRTCPKCSFINPDDFKFCGNCAAKLISTKATGISTPPADTKSKWRDTRAVHEAERRQITVLFCDMVGSTALSEGLDPEDLRDVMREYRQMCDAAIGKVSGYIAQYLGDGILAYFGFPLAHEDDAYRAVQAGLELVNNVSALNTRLKQYNGLELAIRVGIHTGLVVVGELGDGDKRSLALGQTPNIAARLQDMAERNGIVISNATYMLVHRQFEFAPLGEHNLKGLSQPITLYQVSRELEERKANFDDLTALQTPLIGREQESALLIDRLNQAKSGQGHVVLLSGEAGIGKSRLAQFIHESISSESSFIFEGWGSQYYQNSYLHTIIELFRREFGIDNIDNLEEALAAIETPLASYGLPLSDNVPLLANLLSIPLPEDRYPRIQLTPQQQKQKTLDLLLALVIAIAAQRFVAVIIEDLQWIDPTTLELIGMLIDQTPGTNIFVLLTFRTEYTPPWKTRAHLTQIAVNPLTRKQSGRMIGFLTKDKLLPIEVFNEIINKTDGTPIFVEELTKMVLASSILKETHDYYELAAPLSSMAIPSTLQDSLMAKLDSLGPEKELAQLSATLGREFGHRLLKAVAGITDKKFETSLTRLVYAELFYRRGLPPEASYTFRHALVYEVAYQSLLKKTRQQYHKHIAATLIEQFPDVIAESPEIVAHHCSEAGDYSAAIKYWITAGKKALQCSANLDAIAHFKHGLASLDGLPDSQQTTGLELTINVSLGVAYMLQKGYAAAEVEATFARAYTLCGKIGDSAEIFPVLAGLWEFYVVRGDLATAQELAQKLYTIAKQSTDQVLYLEAQRALGSTYFWRGRLSEAHQYLQRGINVKLEDRQRRISTQSYSQDTEVANLSNAACVLWLMGFPDKCLETSRQSVALAEQLQHPFTRAYAYFFHSIAFQLCGDVAGTLAESQQIISLAEEYKFPFWQATGLMMESWALMQKDADSNHIGVFEDALNAYQNTGSRLAISYFQVLLAELYCQIEDYEQAKKTVDTALQEAGTSGECLFEAELYRVKAVAIIAENPADTGTAQQCLQKAISIAQRQKAKSLELRAATKLCDILMTNGDLQAAKQLLDVALGEFSEGFNSKDLGAAKRLSKSLNT